MNDVLDAATIDRIVARAKALPFPMQPIQMHCRSCGHACTGYLLLNSEGLVGQRNGVVLAAAPEPPWFCGECLSLAVYPEGAGA